MKKTDTKYRSCLFLSLIFSLCAQAEIYQKVDSSGKMYFSDLHTPDSAPLVLKPINSYAPLQKKQAAPDTENKTEKNPYQRFVLKQPRAQENFQHTATVSGVLEIEPGLEEGERIQWWLDGKRVQEGSGTEYTTPLLERGEHTLQAMRLDMKKHVLMQTEIVHFYVHLPHS